MPTRRLGDAPNWAAKRPCQDPDHSPPSHMSLEPGVYEHICPTCGELVQFVVSVVTMVAAPDVYTINRREELTIDANKPRRADEIIAAGDWPNEAYF